jgi:hypothetical protein
MEARKTIIAEFALWAAVSAAKQGCKLKGNKWYPHLRLVNLDDLFELPAPVSPESFTCWHHREVEDLAKRADVAVGWAAKLVNMLTKTNVYIAGQGDRSLLRVIHPPIDNRLVIAVQRKFPLKGRDRHSNQEIRRLCALGKPIGGVASYEQYLEVIRGFQFAAERFNWTLFETERLWQPDDSEDTVSDEEC